MALFNLTHQWAYRARLRYTEYSEWSETVYAFASLKNASVIADEFSRGPMGEGEVLQVANSIARWVWRNITPEQTVTNRKRWGSSLGKKSAEIRQKTRDERIQEYPSQLLGGTFRITKNVIVKNFNITTISQV
ncbi:MAG: hypothetical protein Q4C74_05210 [Rothia sp. (in: high G+C Gram-positive bacteria)]|nr:hypothetical protein [Rothia sp. (in: high G+C Gram-positive bacteria)]